jgi:hypothetical protein
MFSCNFKDTNWNKNGGGREGGLEGERETNGVEKEYFR